MKTEFIFLILAAAVVGGILSILHFTTNNGHARSPTLAHTRAITGCDTDLPPTEFFDCAFTRLDARISALEAVHGSAQ